MATNVRAIYISYFGRLAPCISCGLFRFCLKLSDETSFAHGASGFQTQGLCCYHCLFPRVENAIISAQEGYYDLRLFKGVSP